MQAALVGQGAVARLVGPRIGRMRTASGDMIDADASLENEPGFLFDALVLPDGKEARRRAPQDGHTWSSSRTSFATARPSWRSAPRSLLLSQAGLPVSMDKSMAQGGTGLILAAAADAESVAADFIANVARHRHFGREMDPPLL